MQGKYKKKRLSKKAKKIPSRAEIYHIHAARRFAGRCNTEIKEHDFKYMKRQIHEQTSLFIKKGNTSERSIHIVKVNNRHYKVVYDKKVKSIVTVYGEVAEKEYFDLCITKINKKSSS